MLDGLTGGGAVATVVGVALLLLEHLRPVVRLAVDDEPVHVDDPVLTLGRGRLKVVVRLRILVEELLVAHAAAVSCWWAERTGAWPAQSGLKHQPASWADVSLMKSGW
jgi:hypothetical protein